MNRATSIRKEMPFGLSKQQVTRLQHILDTDAKTPAELAQEWGISVSAAKKDVARIRAKVGASSMAALLTKGLHAGAITLTCDSGSAHALPGSQSHGESAPATAENVSSGVLDNSVPLIYNVPVVPLVRFSRLNLEERQDIMAPKTFSLVPTGSRDELAENKYRAFHCIDDPEFSVACAASRDRNNRLAVAAGLPLVGSSMINNHGIMWVVDSHQYVKTANSAERWKQGAIQQDDLYPMIIPQNLSARLSNFLTVINRCTTKTFALLDTTPDLRPGASPDHHWIDTVADPNANFVFLDAVRVNESIIAHEIGHAWVQYVDGCEDMRVMKDVSNRPRLHQLDFVRSFVLDLKVNDLIRQKGFDMRPIEDDIEAGIDSLVCLLRTGYVPPNRREEVFMALQLAAKMLDEDRLRTSDSRPYDALVSTGVYGQALFSLASQFAAVVRSHGYSDRSSVLNSIDECLLIAFGHTGDGIDLENDLIIPEEEEPDFDKFPDWLRAAPVRFKCEVGWIMAKNEIPADSQWSICLGPGLTSILSFELPDGSHAGPWQIDHPFPFDRGLSILQVMEINRQNRERLINQLRKAATPPPQPWRPAGTPSFVRDPLPFVSPAVQPVHQQSGHPGHPVAGFVPPQANQLGLPSSLGPTHSVGSPNTQSIASPRPAGLPALPPAPGARHYMAGLGRFLTQTRLAQQRRGEHPYGYAYNNPVTLADPSGLDALCSGGSCQFPGRLKDCTSLKSKAECWKCAYVYYLGGFGSGDACGLANRACGTHLNCDKPQPYPFPSPPEPPVICSTWSPIIPPYIPINGFTFPECVSACLKVLPGAYAICRQLCHLWKDGSCDALFDACDAMATDSPAAKACFTIYDDLCLGL